MDKNILNISNKLSKYIPTILEKVQRNCCCKTCL